MKKEYISPAVSIVKVDNSLMQVAISKGAAKDEECYSKNGVISFDDDEDEDVAIGW